MQPIYYIYVLYIIIIQFFGSSNIHSSCFMRYHLVFETSQIRKVSISEYFSSSYIYIYRMILGGSNKNKNVVIFQKKIMHLRVFLIHYFIEKFGRIGVRIVQVRYLSKFFNKFQCLLIDLRVLIGSYSKFC